MKGRFLLLVKLNVSLLSVNIIIIIWNTNTLSTWTQTHNHVYITHWSSLRSRKRLCCHTLVFSVFWIFISVCHRHTTQLHINNTRSVFIITSCVWWASSWHTYGFKRTEPFRLMSSDDDDDDDNMKSLLPKQENFTFSKSNSNLYQSNSKVSQ